MEKLSLNDAMKKLREFKSDEINKEIEKNSTYYSAYLKGYNAGVKDMADLFITHNFSNDNGQDVVFRIINTYTETSRLFRLSDLTGWEDGGVYVDNLTEFIVIDGKLKNIPGFIKITIDSIKQV